MARSESLLFADHDLRDALAARRQSALNEIARYDPQRLLNTNLEDLARYLVSKYQADAPSADDENISLAQAESQVDVSHRWDFGGFDGERVVVPGTRLTLHVPINGDIEFLKYRASTFSMRGIHGRVENQELLLTYEAPHNEAHGAKHYFDQVLPVLKQHLAWAAADIAQFNLDLKRVIRSEVEARRARVLANHNLAAALGFPIRQKTGAPKTYEVPGVRRKAVPPPPPASTAPYLPEPALSDDIYEHILTILGSMVRVMEQSPEAFSTMGEQDLRTHFLVQLNGQYEGNATGETFHGSGRTDILLSERDKSVFIAECKFWDGPASLVGAIDQLLDYATWRDAKAAILIFNRNADFSQVVVQIPAVISGHPHSSGAVTSVGETVFRSRLRLRDDSSREILVTTMVFNVPAKRTTSPRLKRRSGRTTE